MSYEGYVQTICENGHYSEFDAHDTRWVRGEIECPECESEIVWVNEVDETNCDGYGYIEVELDKPAVTETCDHCGHTRVVEEETYKIPGDDAVRMYYEWDYENSMPVYHPIKRRDDG